MKRLALLGGAAFLLALVAVWPARWLAGLLPDSVQCTNWRGSVWNGQCLGLQVSGPQPLDLDTLHWKLRPASLLRLAVSADFAATYAQGDVDGHITLQRDGLVTLEGVSLRSLLDRSLVGALPAGWNGRVEIAALDASWQGPELRQLSGTLSIHDLRDARGAALGNYQLALAPASQPPFKGQLVDRGGPFAVRTEVLVQADRSWSLDGTVAPREESAGAFDSQLELLGPADANGQRRLSIGGNFN